MLKRYCFELEKISDDRFEGIPLAVYESEYNSAGARSDEISRLYAVYDRKRGLYDAICYVPRLEDAEQIVDALNTLDASR
jgi:hypothetical protein